MNLAKKDLLRVKRGVLRGQVWEVFAGDHTFHWKAVGQKGETKWLTDAINKAHEAILEVSGK